MDNANVSKSLVTQPEPASDVYHVGGMTAKEHEQLKKMHQKLISTIDLSMLGTMEEEEARKQIREIAESVLSQDVVLPLSVDARRRLVKLLQDEVLGLGPLEPLIADETITDIMVNGPYQVYVEQKGKLRLTDVKFRDNQHVLNICTRIVTKVGRRVDESSPICDARLLDGSRVNIIIPPLAIDGAAISIRKFAKQKITFDQMVGSSMSEEMATTLCIAGRVRLNTVVSGGTGSGKTTLLNALSSMIGEDERVITIEDAAALQLIVQISRMRDGGRRIQKITEVTGMEGDVVTMQDLFSYEFIGEDENGKLLGEWRKHGVRPNFTPRAQYYGLDKDLLEACL